MDKSVSDSKAAGRRQVSNDYGKIGGMRIMMDRGHSRHTLRRFVMAITAVLCAGQVAAAPAFDPDRLGWQSAEFRASKLFMSAEAELSVEAVAAASRAAALLEPPLGTPVAPGDRILVISAVSRGFGRTTDMELLIDPTDGAALQRTTHDSGSKFRHRIYRYTREGAFHRSWWPEKGEEQQPWESWSERSEGMRPYPADLPSEPVAEPTALIYMIAASTLAAPGDRLEVLTFARRAVHRVTAEVADAEPLQYRFVDTATGAERKGRLTPVLIRLRGDTLGDDDDDFELLGLRGDIDLYLEPGSRAPLQLSGKVKLAGQVDFRLTSLTPVPGRK